MPKSEKFPDLSISREVSHRIRTAMCDMLSSYIADSVADGLDEDHLFAVRYLETCLVSKYIDENTETAEVRRHSAISKWLGVEQRNKRTNHRLYWSDPSFKHERGTTSGQAFLLLVRNLVSKTLGPVPDDILSSGGFSGGATTSVKRGPGTLATKFTGSRDVTPACWAVLSNTVQQAEAWTFHNPEVLQPRFVKGNILFTVPKTPVIDRVACKEPDFNIFAQKAVGDYIRRRLLRKARINLNDQSINRSLAQFGSKHGSHATIDLSSASDSLTYGLVSSVLPREWFDLLRALRSPKTFIDGLSHENEMFSSMGNGFTFELESLIFWSIARVVRDRFTNIGVDSSDNQMKRISVYGDDIIVPTRCARMTITMLNWCGFTVNVKKTFITGPFRESCGGHYYRGLDVSPFFLRRPIGHVSDLILFLNQFRDWLIRTEMDSVERGWTCKNRFVRFWYNLASFVPRSLWGGCDIASRTQLVSPGSQACELLQTTRRWARLETDLQVGLYLTRLRDLDRRRWDTIPDDTIDGSILRVPTHKYVIRRSKVQQYVFGLVKPLFLIEQGYYVD